MTLVLYIKLKQKIWRKKEGMDFNAIIKQKSIRVGGWKQFIVREVARHIKLKPKIWRKKKGLDFNAIIKQKSIRVGGWKQFIVREVARHIKRWLRRN